jgi:hypothetical protein
MTFYIHVGAPKTASTTLQGRFFPAHPGIFYLGKEESALNSVKRWATTDIYKTVNDINRLNLSFHLDQTALQSALKYIKENCGCLAITCSNEDICAFNGASPFEKFARYQEIFAEFKPVRVIMGIRNQIELLKSAYITIHRAEHLHIDGEKMTWSPTFDQYIDINFKYAFGAYLEAFRFSVVLDHYANAIGRENIFLYSFKDLQGDPVATLRRLCRFMGIDENAACVIEAATTKENQHFSARRYAYLNYRWLILGKRSVSELVPRAVKSRFVRWLDSGPKFDVTPSPAVTKRLQDYYRADNDLLAEKYGIAL